MTAAEWETCDDPQRLVAAVDDTVFCSKWPHGSHTKRKRTLFGLACCRLVWPWVVVDERCRRAVEYEEAECEGHPPDIDVDELYGNLKDAERHPDDGTPLM